MTALDTLDVDRDRTAQQTDRDGCRPRSGTRWREMLRSHLPWRVGASPTMPAKQRREREKFLRQVETRGQGSLGRMQAAEGTLIKYDRDARPRNVPAAPVQR